MPQTSTFAVTSGTGSYAGATGRVKVTFGSQFEGAEYEVLTITLQ